MIYKNVHHEKAGDVFAARLLLDLPPESVAALCAANAKESDRGVCHSHDYCDANEYMADALESLGIPEPYEGSDEDLCQFWRAAWDYAHVRHFGGKRDGYRVTMRIEPMSGGYVALVRTVRTPDDITHADTIGAWLTRDEARALKAAQS